MEQPSIFVPGDCVNTTRLGRLRASQKQVEGLVTNVSHMDDGSFRYYVNGHGLYERDELELVRPATIESITRALQFNWPGPGCKEVGYTPRVKNPTEDLYGAALHMQDDDQDD